MCCVRCFNDEHTVLINLIREHGAAKATCDFCGTENTIAVEPDVLSDEIVRLSDLYSPLEYGRNVGHDENWIDVGDSFADLIDEDFWIVSDAAVDQRSELIDAIVGRAELEGYPLESSGLFCRRSQNFGHRSFIDMWEAFSNHLQTQRRFVPKKDQFGFLPGDISWLPEFLEEVRKPLAAGSTVYRARRGKQPVERMGAPPHDLATAGRANSHAIPVLYLATDAATAVAELRPWRGQVLSVGAGKFTRDLPVADLTDTPVLKSPFGVPPDVNLNYEYEKNAVLAHLSGLLGLPVDPDRASIDYLPTQYLAELVQDAGFDGMIYASALGPGTGKNMVLFDDALVAWTDVELHQVTDILYKTKPPSDP